MYLNTSGSNNSFFGYQSGYRNSTAHSNSYFGYQAGYTNSTGTSNAFFGYQSGYANTASANSAFGYSSLRVNTTGNYNSAFGAYALNLNTTGIQNSAFGYWALQSNTADNNTAFGAYTLSLNTTGHENSAFGSGGLYNNTNGSSNNAFGYYALQFNQGGNDNNAFGTSALKSNSSGYRNSAFGNNALLSNTTGTTNTAIGINALSSNTTSSFNTAVGAYALDVIANGSPGNVALGWTALSSSLNTYNVGVGYSAGENKSGNQYCTYLGYDADASASSVVVNSMALGNGSRIGLSNQVSVGNTSVTSIGGYADWTTFSDGRFKKNIKEEVPGLKFITMLRPLTYTLNVHDLREYLGEDKVYSDNTLQRMEDKGIDVTLQHKPWNEEKEKIIYTGFIAQEVEAAAKKLNYDFSGVDKPQDENGLYGLRYAEFVVPLVKAVQELSQQNDELKKQNDLQQQEIDELKTLITGNQHTSSSQSVKINSSGVILTDAALQQNIPNPFNHTTTINYTLPQQYSSAKIIITDKAGKVLKEVNLPALPTGQAGGRQGLSNSPHTGGGREGAGKGSLQVDASALASGAYQYSLYVDGRLIDTKQMEHIK